MAELLAAARIEAHYAKLDEAAKRVLLVGLLNDARPLRVVGSDYSAHAQSELAIFEAARTARARFGKEAIRHYIISHTETVSDLLEVLLLQKEVGLMHGTLDGKATNDLIVVPLFETIEDLRNAAPIMREFYALPGIAQLVKRTRRRAGHHARLLRQQQGRRHLHQQLGAATAPRSRWSSCSTCWPTRTTSSCACSTAAAAPWAAAAAPATRPSWPSHRARCAGRSA